MTTGYRIKDVADRSGFTAATLRYYEQIGLLPEATRTPGGYRLYDDRTLDRLAFIARAKHVGCSLDEIADLTLAWDGGQCGPVQDRLRTVVIDKLAGAQQQIVELMILTTDLQRAAASLELHRPDGPCDDQCGCVSDTAAGAQQQPQAIQLVGKPNVAGKQPVVDEQSPIACTLASRAMPIRLDEWRALLTHVVRRDPIDNGVRATFGPSTPLDELIRLTVGEQDCCQFLNFAITVDSRGIALEVRAPDHALQVVHALFGTPT